MFKIKDHGVISGLKNDFPIYRPWAVIRIKSDWAKSAKTELPPIGGISEKPGNTFPPIPARYVLSIGGFVFEDDTAVIFRL